MTLDELEKLYPLGRMIKPKTLSGKDFLMVKGYSRNLAGEPVLILDTPGVTTLIHPNNIKNPQEVGIALHPMVTLWITPTKRTDAYPISIGLQYGSDTDYKRYLATKDSLSDIIEQAENLIEEL